MRRLGAGEKWRLLFVVTLAIAALLLAPSGCKRKKKTNNDEATTDGSSKSSTLIEVADPRFAVQLIHGFYDPEGDAWRWTAKQFSAVLHPPANARYKGARLILKFSIPAISIQRLHSLMLSATVNGLVLPSETYTQSGEYTFSRDVAAEALTSTAVTADFVLDKALPPGGEDRRELGIVAEKIGFEAKK